MITVYLTFLASLSSRVGSLETKEFALICSVKAKGLQGRLLGKHISVKLTVQPRKKRVFVIYIFCISERSLWRQGSDHLCEPLVWWWNCFSVIETKLHSLIISRWRVPCYRKDDESIPGVEAPMWIPVSRLTLASPSIVGGDLSFPISVHSLCKICSDPHDVSHKKYLLLVLYNGFFKCDKISASKIY